MTELKSDASTMSVDDLLRAAARLIERALIHLNVDKDTCAKCGTTHYHNKTHARLYLRYTDLPNKLKESADELEGLNTSKRNCIECREAFSLNKPEIEWFLRHNLDLPLRCKKCRDVMRQRKADAVAQGKAVRRPSPPRTERS
jgi:hypothetical protein